MVRKKLERGYVGTRKLSVKVPTWAPVFWVGGSSKRKFLLQYKI